MNTTAWYSRFSASSLLLGIFLLCDILRPIFASTLYISVDSTFTSASGSISLTTSPSGAFPGLSGSYKSTITIGPLAVFQYLSTDTFTAASTSLTTSKTAGPISSSSYYVVNDIVSKAGVSSFSMNYGIYIQYSWSSSANIAQAMIVTDGTNTYYIVNYPALAESGLSGSVSISGGSSVTWTPNTSTIWVVKATSSATLAIKGTVTSSQITTTTASTKTSAASRLSTSDSTYAFLALSAFTLIAQLLLA